MTDKNPEEKMNIYEEYVAGEIEERASKTNDEYYNVLDAFFKEINELGYDYKYEIDIDMEEYPANDLKIIPIVKKYVTAFVDPIDGAYLLQFFQGENYKETIPFILETIENNKKYDEVTRRRMGLWLDNVLFSHNSVTNTKDYLKLLEDEVDASSFRLTVALLGKWKVEEARKYFLTYLNSKDMGLVLTSIKALHNFGGYEVYEAISELRYHNEPKVAKAVKKIMSQKKNL